MENFGRAMPVSYVSLLTALLSHQQVYACFIDFQKAYDSVWYNAMFPEVSFQLRLYGGVWPRDWKIDPSAD